MERLPNKEAAVKFILDSTSISRLQAASEMIKADSLSEESADHSNWYGYFNEALRVVLNQMIEEIELKIRAYQPEAAKRIVDDLKLDLLKIEEHLTVQNIDNNIVLYNKALREHKLDKVYPVLTLNTKIYMSFISLAIRRVNEATEHLIKLYETRVETGTRTTEHEKNSYPVEHKLRWIDNRTNFEGFWLDLINDGSLSLADGRNVKDEIFHILKVVFEKVDVNNKTNRRGRDKTFPPLNKSKIYIPQRLFWNHSPKQFASHFKPFLNMTERCIFIDKYNVTELPNMVKVLTDLITIKKEKGQGSIKAEALLTMIKTKDITF